MPHISIDTTKNRDKCFTRGAYRNTDYSVPDGALAAVRFDDIDQCFRADSGEKTIDLVQTMDRPLSLTFQLTRGCNFGCEYCSEPPGIESRPHDEMLAMIDKLAGMRRIIFSGGEPMQYKHFWEVLEYSQGKFERIVLSTNASMITREGAARLKGLVHYIDITVDGPRRQHNGIRGQYDWVIRGLRRAAEEDIPLSVICVFMETPTSNKNAIHYIAQTADVFGARKCKVLTTIPKGYSKDLFADFTTGAELDTLREFLQQEKAANGWLPRITIADWMRIGPGHAILIEPDGRAVASPVWDAEECIKPFGNLHEQTAGELWEAYPYKRQHLDKYLERTMIVMD